MKLPAGFDPLTATDAELSANDLPMRPTSPADLGQWRNFVTGKVKAQPSRCSFISGRPGEPPSRSGTTATSVADPHTANWAGYEADGHTYSDAYATWKVPNVGIRNKGNNGTFSSEWVGIGLGGSKGKPLVQAGNEADFQEPGVAPPEYDIWWEVVPQFGYRHVIPGQVNPGNVIYVHIHLTRNNAQVTIRDEWDGAGGTFSYRSGSFSSDGHAEWILERTEQYFLGRGWTYPSLADATTVFTKAEADAPGLSLRGLGHLPLTGPITMWTCTRPIEELAYPGGIASNRTQFTANFKQIGHDDPARC